MKNEIIQRIDILIESAANLTNTQFFFQELGKLIFQYLDLDCDDKQGIALISNKELSQNHKRFISFLLLRIYSINA